MQSNWLHDFLYQEENFQLILEATGGGWLDGGCLILSDALLEWLGEGAETYFLCVTSGRLSEAGLVDWPEHAVVRYGDTYLDGDGASSETALLLRWEREEGIAEGWLTPTTKEMRLLALENGMPEDSVVSHELAQRLQAAFSVIPPDLAPSVSLV